MFDMQRQALAGFAFADMPLPEPGVTLTELSADYLMPPRAFEAFGDASALLSGMAADLHVMIRHEAAEESRLA